MKSATHPTPTSFNSKLVPTFFLGIFVLAGIALRMGALSWIMHPANSHSESEHGSIAVDESDWLANKTVQLSGEKLAAAKIAFATAESRPLNETRTVPGTITYDEAKRLDLSAPVECIVRQVLVEPGSEVILGQPLVVLFSAEVGLARDEVLKREADFAVAKREQLRASEIAVSVGELLELLATKPKLVDLEQQLADKQLGDYREKLVVAYSKLLLAQSAAEGTDGLTDIGAISQRIVDERRSAREVAAAQFSGSCETAKFSATQEKEKAQAAADQAARLLAVSQEKLATLVGPLAMAKADSTEGLGDFTLRAPLAGRIEERFVVSSARYMPGKPLFTLADTSHLWVSAEIHEQDWSALQQTRDLPIQIRVPALQEQTFLAKVRFIGSQVSAEKRSIPLVADLPNPDGKFKPGMFVWALVPSAKERNGIVVPSGAVMQHQGRSFVFTPKGQNQFTPLEVKLGAEQPGFTEILEGLKAGEKVVAQGTFILKSELLLDREPE